MKLSRALEAQNFLGEKVSTNGGEMNRFALPTRKEKTRRGPGAGETHSKLAINLKRQKVPTVVKSKGRVKLNPISSC